MAIPSVDQEPNVEERQTTEPVLKEGCAATKLSSPPSYETALPYIERERGNDLFEKIEERMWNATPLFRVGEGEAKTL